MGQQILRMVLGIKFSINQYQIEEKQSMKLRHKKPTNSYAGQVNHDSNSIQDEDFEKNNQQIRREKYGKTKVVSEKTKKYAQILSDFVKVVNQNYKRHSRGYGNQIGGRGELQKIQGNQENLDKKIAQNPQRDPNYEISSKQYQIKRDFEQNTFRVPQSFKKIRKERARIQEPPKPRNQRFPPPLKPSIPLREPQQSVTTPIPQKKETQKTPQTRNEQQHSQQPTPQMFQNMYFPQIPANMLNLLQFQMPMMGYSNQQQMGSYQNSPNSNQLQLLYNIMSMNPQISQSSANQYISFNKLPFFNQENYQSLLKNQIQQASQVGSNPFSQQFSASKPAKKTDNPPRANETNSEPQGLASQRVEEKVPNFNQRASTHISIAYNIHFHNLKKKGIIRNNVDEIKNPELINKIDPTYPAKRIRELNKEQGKKNPGSIIEISEN